MEDKKTSEVWKELLLKDIDIQILDPDGWDRENWEYSFQEEKIAAEEFRRRVGMSTIMAHIDAWEELDKRVDKFMNQSKKKKKIVFLDMDGVLADFEANASEPNKLGDASNMLSQGFFRDLPVMDGARAAVDLLLKQDHLDIYIGSKPTSKQKNHSGIDYSFYCHSEKQRWIAQYFPELIQKVNLICDKTLLKGDFLIDDDPKWSGFDGEFILFDPKNIMQSWKTVFEKLEIKYGV